MPAPQRQALPRAGVLARVLNLDREERAAAAWSFLCFFSILCAYFLLRPVRDELAILAGPENIPNLFIGTFVAVLLVIPAFGWITRRFERRIFLPGLFVFFVLNLIGFYWAFGAQWIDQAWVGRAFFVWLSVFNMFVVSLFWSFMADLYSREQARRLFGLIAGGGSAGAIVGPLVTALFVERIGIAQLFLISAGLLSLTVVTILRLIAWGQRHAHDAHPVTEHRPLGGGVFEGVALIARDRYLSAIAVFFLIGTFCGTAMYMFQATLFSEMIPDSGRRTQLLAAMDTSINVLALFLQVVVARHAIAKLGVAVTLSLLPLLSLVVFVVLSLAPGVALLVVAQVLRRATNFGLNGPARENLFTVVSTESKYKAKNVLDVTLVRAADVLSSQSIRLLLGLGQSFAPVTWLCAGLCGAWLAIVVWVGRRYRQLFDAQAPAGPASAATPPRGA